MKTPILMYHCVSQASRGGRYILSSERFSRQMHWLKANDYEVISLGQLLACREVASTGSPKQVAVTFDDGYQDTFQHARPVLLSLGFNATFFFVSGYMGRSNQWDRIGEECAGSRVMDWDQARQLGRDGFTIGAHSVTHSALTELSLDRATYEINQSRAELESQIGAPVGFFAFPYGLWNAHLGRIVREAGYEGACLTQPGFNNSATDRFALRRIEICGTDSLQTFAWKLRFGVSKFGPRDLVGYYGRRLRARLIAGGQ